MLYVICYMLYVICYMLYVICYMLYVICYMLYVICYMLYVICYMLYVICYMLYCYIVICYIVICYMLYVILLYVILLYVILLYVILLYCYIVICYIVILLYVICYIVICYMLYCYMLYCYMLYCYMLYCYMLYVILLYVILLYVICYMLYVILLYVILLYVILLYCYMLYCYMLYVICYMLYVICYMLYVICYMLYVICYMLYVICYMLYVICYMLYVICYMLYVICYIVICYIVICYIVICYIVICYMLYCYMLYCYILYCYMLYVTCYIVICYMLYVICYMLYVILLYVILLYVICYMLYCYMLYVICYIVICYNVICYMLYVIWYMLYVILLYVICYMLYCYMLYCYMLYVICYMLYVILLYVILLYVILLYVILLYVILLYVIMLYVILLYVILLYVICYIVILLYCYIVILLYCYINMKKQKFETRYKWIRNEKQFDEQKFYDDFLQYPLSLIYAFDDPNDQLLTLNKLFRDCLDNHAPLRRVKLTRPPAPWMRELNVANNQIQCENLRKIAQNDNTEIAWNNYRNSRNSLKKVIKSTKASYFKKALLSRKSKEVWSTINKILKPNPRRIKANPNDLNTYFSTLASTITGSPVEIGDLFQHIDNTIPDNNDQESFTIQPTSYNEVMAILKSLRNDCSTGFDCIPIKYVKMVADILASPLTHIINNSIRNNMFPTEWKTARVCPIPKVKFPVELKDYRPISVLPVLSKVFEKIILKQLLTFIDSNNIYSPNQSGYRKGHSSTTLILKLRDDIQRALNKSEVSISVFADYSKAFDTVHYKHLIEKLSLLKFSISSIHLIYNYLTNRKQFVQVDDVKSTSNQVNYGVPQGSILGPILFNLYVHDMSRQLKSTCIQFADDTSIYRSCKVKDINQTSIKVEEDLGLLQSWSTDTNLVFNESKTKTVLFSTKQMSTRHNLSDESLYCIKCNNKPIERKSVMKVLGVTLKHDLSWTEHVQSVITEGYSTLRSLKSIKRLTPFYLRKSLAESLVLSKIDYSIAVLKGSPSYLIKRLQKLQNSTAGYVFGRYSSIEDVSRLKWLSINNRLDFTLAKMAFKSFHNATWPEYLKIERYEPARTLRSSGRENLLKRSYEDKTFSEQAALVFNSLPAAIRAEQNFSKFYTESKLFFLGINSL